MSEIVTYKYFNSDFGWREDFISNDRKYPNFTITVSKDAVEEFYSSTNKNYIDVTTPTPLNAETVKTILAEFLRIPTTSINLSFAVIPEHYDNI